MEVLALKGKDRTDFSVFDYFLRPHYGGKEAVIEHRPADRALLFSQSGQLVRLGGGEGQGLLAKHRLTCQDGGLGHLIVEGIGGAYVDHVNIRVRDDLLGGSRGAGDAVLGGKGLRPLRGGRAHHSDLGLKAQLGGFIEEGQIPHRPQVSLSHESDADEPDTQFFHSLAPVYRNTSYII